MNIIENLKITIIALIIGGGFGLALSYGLGLEESCESQMMEEFRKWKLSSSNTIQI